MIAGKLTQKKKQQWNPEQQAVITTPISVWGQDIKAAPLIQAASALL